MIILKQILVFLFPAAKRKALTSLTPDEPNSKGLKESVSHVQYSQKIVPWEGEENG